MQSANTLLTRKISTGAPAIWSSRTFHRKTLIPTWYAFALSQMPKEDGVPKLIQVAQTNRNPEVRKQAMFWLGQSNDPRALEFFEKVLAK